MNVLLSAFRLLTLYSLFCCPLLLQAQSVEANSLQQRLRQADRLIELNHTDSAKVILSELTVQVEDRNMELTQLGLQIRLSNAYAALYTESHVALADFLRLIDDGLQAKAYEIAAQAYLSVALIHELLLDEEQCLATLNETQQLIQIQNIASAEARYAVRRSSYHAQLTKNLDSAFIYAQRAVNLTENEPADRIKGDAHLLMSKLAPFPTLKDQAEYTLKVADIYASYDNQVVSALMLSSAANRFLYAEEFRLATFYLDSIDVLLKSGSLFNQYDLLAVKSTSSRSRAKLYKETGQFDSAWYYLKLNHSYDKQLDNLMKTDSIAAIQLQYENQKELDAKDQLIATERNRQKWLWIVCIIVALAAALLIHYALKLQKANRTTSLQAESLTVTNTRLADALHQQMVLQGEVHHRVKNNLQIIISLLELQSDEIEDQSAVVQLESMASRIHSMAAVHEMLYQQQGRSTVNLRIYLSHLYVQIGQISGYHPLPDFQLHVTNDDFNLATAMPIGLMVNELLTNSFKYAERSASELMITIDLKKEADGYRLMYRDNGVGFPKAELQERDGGLGTYLLKNMVRQLQGHFYTYNDNGAVFDIFFNAKRSARVKMVDVAPVTR
ncbi:MAG: sensor histidine kinase [Bacteroidota bacterium]